MGCRHCVQSDQPYLKGVYWAPCGSRMSSNRTQGVQHLVTWHRTCPRQRKTSPRLRAERPGAGVAKAGFLEEVGLMVRERNGCPRAAEGHKGGGLGKSNGGGRLSYREIVSQTPVWHVPSPPLASCPDPSIGVGWFGLSGSLPFSLPSVLALPGCLWSGTR